MLHVHFDGRHEAIEDENNVYGCPNAYIGGAVNCDGVNREIVSAVRFGEDVHVKAGSRADGPPPAAV